MAGDTRYFASLPSTEFGAELFRKIDGYYRYVDQSGLGNLIRRSVAQKLGANLKNGAVSWEVKEGGEQGEFKHTTENVYRQLGEHKVTLTTQQRPAIQCSAANTDKKSIEQRMLADGLVEFHLTEKSLEDLLVRAVDRGVFESEGFIEGGWDVHSGDEVAPEEEEFSGLLDKMAAGEDVSNIPIPVRKSGEPMFRCLGPMDVGRDPAAQSFKALTWVFTRRLVSKFDLAAQYPDMAEKVLNLSARNAGLTHYKPLEVGKPDDSETDLVPLWTFYHLRTAAMPEGRHVIAGAPDCILFDGPIPYRDIPLRRCTPRDMDDRPFGWTPMFDLLGPQEVIGAIDTVIVSNELGRGVGNILVHQKANVSVEALSSSMNEVKWDGEHEPKPMEWPETPAEFFSYKAEKKNAMAELLGTNAVALGTPNEMIGQDGSGAKMALFEATATRNNSALEKSYANLCRDVAQLIIHLYADFGGSVERQAKIIGKANGYILKSFTSEDLADVDRVKVDMGNPVLRSPSGKMALADKLVELKLIGPGEVDKYIHVMKDGNADPLMEAKQAQLLRIRGENEQLMQGQGQHRALLSDPHWNEIGEHLSLLDNPALREESPENEQLQALILEAVQQHVDLFMQMPPWMVLLRGGPEAMAVWQQIAATMAPATGTPPPAPGQPSQTPQPKSGASTPTAPANPDASKPGQAGMPSMPSMPTNPATGEPADLEGVQIQ